MTFMIKPQSYPLGYSNLVPEGICGVTDFIAQPIIEDKQRPRTKRVKSIKRSVKDVVSKRVPTSVGISGLNIDYKGLDVPKHIKHLKADNTVEVEESLLQKVARVTDNRAARLGRMLLANTAPSILAYTASMNYVSAIMQDSFGIELEEDPAMPEALRDITKFEVLEFFVQRLKIPNHRKELILSSLIDKITSKTVERMELATKRGSNENKVKALEAVLASRSTGTRTGAPGVVLRSKNPADTQERILERPMITTKDRKSTRI